MPDREFFRSTVTLTVLSDRSIADDALGVILENCDDGDCVLASLEHDEETLTRPEMDEALTKAGSDPSFFPDDDEDDEGGLVLQPPTFDATKP